MVTMERTILHQQATIELLLKHTQLLAAPYQQERREIYRQLLLALAKQDPALAARINALRDPLDH